MVKWSKYTDTKMGRPVSEERLDKAHEIASYVDDIKTEGIKVKLKRCSCYIQQTKPFHPNQNVQRYLLLSWGLVLFRIFNNLKVKPSFLNEFY